MCLAADLRESRYHATCAGGTFWHEEDSVYFLELCAVIIGPLFCHAADITHNHRKSWGIYKDVAKEIIGFFGIDPFPPVKHP